MRETLTSEFSRVTPAVADEALRGRRVDPSGLAPKLDGPHIEAIHAVMVSSQAALPPAKRFFSRLAKSDKTLRDDDGGGQRASRRARRGRRAPRRHRAHREGPRRHASQLDKLYAALRVVAGEDRRRPRPASSPSARSSSPGGLKRRFKAVLHGPHAAAGGVPRQPLRRGGRRGLRRRAAKDEAAELMRFANRVPLLYQPRACGITEAVVKVDWKSYGLQQRKGELPVGSAGDLRPPRGRVGAFTSEAKEAVAHPTRS